MEGKAKKAVNEQEEFEFRLRLEREQSAKVGTPTPSTLDTIAASAPVQFAVGTADPAFGLVQRIGGARGQAGSAMYSAFPLVKAAATYAKPTIDNALAEFNAMAASGGANWPWRFAGNVLSPASLGAGKIGIPASLAGKTALGAGVGAAGGYVAPAANDDEARKNALIGAAVAGALPGALQLGSKAVEWGANNVLRPIADLFTKEGPTNIARKYIRNIVGEGNLDPVLQRTGTAAELVPKSKPTVGEVVADLPEGQALLSLQKITAKTEGGPSAKFAERTVGQADAVEGAKAARSAESAVHYGRAYDTAINKVKADPQLAVMAQNPYFKDAIPEAVKLAESRGITPKDNLTEFLHLVKIGLDRRLNSRGDTALSSAQYAEVEGVKSKLVNWLASKNPDYETGRAAYAKASQAIDADLLRREMVANPLQATTLGGGLDIAEQTRPHLPNLLNRAAMLANFMARKAGYAVEPKVDAAMTEIMLHPERFTEVMSKLPPATRIDVERLIRAGNALSFGGASAQ